MGYREDAEWIRKHHEKLQEKYPGMYVAVYRQRVIAASKDYSDVVKLASKQVPSIKDLAIDYVDSGDLFVL